MDLSKTIGAVKQGKIFENGKLYFMKNLAFSVVDVYQATGLFYSLSNKYFDVENIYGDEYSFNTIGNWTYPKTADFWANLSSSFINNGIFYKKAVF